MLGGPDNSPLGGDQRYAVLRVSQHDRPIGPEPHRRRCARWQTEARTRAVLRNQERTPPVRVRGVVLDMHARAIASLEARRPATEWIALPRRALGRLQRR